EADYAFGGNGVKTSSRPGKRINMGPNCMNMHEALTSDAFSDIFRIKMNIAQAKEDADGTLRRRWRDRLCRR
ncbi:MAG TPA: hypothetical protein VFL04_08440, partial [Rectinemataceae bacterium]|nr:hypothetical protein [Rectinemataceae bacterium]